MISSEQKKRRDERAERREEDNRRRWEASARKAAEKETVDNSSSSSGRDRLKGTRINEEIGGRPSVGIGRFDLSVIDEEQTREMPVIETTNLGVTPKPKGRPKKLPEGRGAWKKIGQNNAGQ